MRLMVFSKHLAGPSLPEIAHRLQSIGIQEIDLTVRPGGHVEPERAGEDLPRAAEELASGGVRIGMISTNITDAAVPTTQAVLRTAAQLGITHYKLGYEMYAGFGTLRRQRDEVRAKWRDLAALNAELGITGGYHNHSDTFFGANLADIEYALDDLAPQQLGLYFDPCHAVIEGGSTGWMMAFDLLADRTVMLAVKDFRWVPKADGYAGARLHSVQFCPLQNGNVPWDKVWILLQQSGFSGPISLHSEYQGRFSFQDLNVDEVFEQTEKDVKLFQEWAQTTPADG